jgi:hypothetical protein
LCKNKTSKMVIKKVKKTDGRWDLNP